jgi:hypothetical protein
VRPRHHAPFRGAFGRNESISGNESSRVAKKQGLKETIGPLRRIVEFVRPARDAFGNARVWFECGHEGSVSSGAIYKGRCRSCRREAAVRAAPGADSSVSSVPPNPNPARSSLKTLASSKRPNLSESDDVVPGRTLHVG